jgi:hypothetical protein
MRCRICNFRARFTLIHDEPDATRGLPSSTGATMNGENPAYPPETLLSAYPETLAG